MMREGEREREKCKTRKIRFTVYNNNTENESCSSNQVLPLLLLLCILLKEGKNEKAHTAVDRLFTPAKQPKQKVSCPINHLAPLSLLPFLHRAPSAAAAAAAAAAAGRHQLTHMLSIGKKCLGKERKSRLPDSKQKCWLAKKSRVKAKALQCN